MRPRILMVVVFVLAVCRWQSATAGPQAACTVTEIAVDGVPVPADSWSTLAISPRSSVRFTFATKDARTDAPFRYVTRLATRDQESVSTSDMATTTKSYGSLAQGFYSFEIRSQGLDSTWMSDPEVHRFVVDDQQAQLFRRAMDLAAQPVRSESQPVAPAIPILSLLLLASIVVIIILIRRNRNVRPSAIDALLASTPVNHDERVSDAERREQQQQEAKVMQMLRDDVVTLRKENDNLIRTVGDLSRKTLELNSQNSELEVQVERVSKVKTELESLQRQKDDVFAIIVHDIKNPASLIKNLVDLLRSYDLNSNETHEVLQDIVDTTTRIVSMSQELSRMMALDQAEIQVSLDDVDISTLVQGVTRRNSSAAQKKGIEIECTVPSGPVHSHVDNAKIEEVVDNLVSNAIKFSLPGTSVKVRVMAEPDYFRIEVEDQGIGMSKEDIQNAFQRGVRLSARPTADEPSSGLGLWIVKRLVEAHEGTVSIRSDVGVGTTFSVLLPYRSAQTEAES
ncbi:MAG: ATP-binding protein [Candidatus Kapaibacterium sp.]